MILDRNQLEMARVGTPNHFGSNQNGANAQSIILLCCSAMEESESASTLNSSDATCNFCGMVDLEKAYDNVILLNLISIGFILAVPVLCYAVFILGS